MQSEDVDRSAEKPNPISGRAERPGSPAIALCLLMTLAGCTASGVPQAQDGRQGRPDLVPSPARDLVLPGHAELVLTGNRWATFEEARANPATPLARDSPLYAHIRTARPLGEVALPADPRGRYSFSRYPHLYLQVGDTESLRSLSTCYVTLSPEHLGSRELVVQLAPPALLPDGAPADCWVAATASSRSRAQTHEIRLSGFVGQYDGWLSQASLLAVATAPGFDNTRSRSAMSPPVEPLRQAVPSVAPSSSLPPPSPPPPLAEPAPVSAAAPASAPTPSPVPVLAPAPVPVPVLVPVSVPVPAPSPAPIAAVARPVPVADAPVRSAPVRLVIRHAEGDAAAESRARELRGRLQAHRKFDVELQPVAESVAADNLRIFFESDRLEARITRELMASGPVPIRDLSEVRPRPRAGTIELWLAASPSSSLPAPSATATEVPTPATVPAESAASQARRSEPPSTPPASRTVSETLRLLLLRPEN
jgi:hypothetical protein